MTSLHILHSPVRLDKPFFSRGFTSPLGSQTFPATRSTLDQLLATDRFVFEIEVTTEDHPSGWRPPTFSQQAIFDLTGNHEALRTVVADCMPPN